MKSVIPLGECPFCGGDVTVGVNEYDSETGMVYFSYGGRPQCENGCPVERFDCQRCGFDDIWVTAKKVQTIAGLVDEWGKLADEKRKENERKGKSAGLADMLNELDRSHS